MNISFWHLLVVLVILIFVFGPSRLDGIGTSLGKAIRGFKQGLNDGAEDDEDKKNKT